MEDNKLYAVENIETVTAQPVEVFHENILSSLKRDLTEIEQLPEFDKPKFDEPFAVAGGGPSIKYTVDTLRNFKTIIACGSAHDWLVEHDIKPRYCIILDPEDVAANYLKHPQPTCTYLLSSACHPKVFDTLKDYPVARWHCGGPTVDWFVKAWEDAGIKDKGDKKPIIGGGPTCGLGAISMGVVFKYKNIHLFGLDSNLDINDSAHHAYDFVDPENEFLGDVLEFRVGNPYTGRRFRVAKYMLAQLYGFKEMISKYGQYFDITVHGDSAIYEFMKQRRLIKDDRDLAERLEITPEIYLNDARNTPTNGE